MGKDIRGLYRRWKCTSCSTTDLGQEVARYTNRRYKLDLLPKEFEGSPAILPRYVENDFEMVGCASNY